MEKIILILLFVGVLPYSTKAQSVVLTWEDGATIQLLGNPNGMTPTPLPAAELISGGLAARLVSNTTESGGPASQWLATDFRLQSASWHVAWNSQACGGHLASITSLTSGVGTLLTIAAQFPTNNSLLTDTLDDPSLGCSPDFDTALVSFGGVQYKGVVQFSGTFTGTVDTPGEVPNATATVLFGPPSPNSAGAPVGIAIIRGTLRVEISDFDTTVVKLRQGIPAGPPPNQTLQDFNPPWEDIQYDSATDPPKNGELENRIYNYGCKLTALSMLLNSVGVRTLPAVSTNSCTSNLNDPCSLNAWMEANNLYDDEGVDSVPVVASLATALGKESLIFNVNEFDSANDSVGAQEFLDATLSGAGALNGVGTPVLAGVDDNCAANQEPVPCHFVVVWGKRNGEYLIADPKPTNDAACLQGGTCHINGIIRGLETTTHLFLSDYDRYIALGYLTDPESVAGLAISTASDINLTLISSTGATAGFSTSGQSVAGRIPNSSYLNESIQNNEDPALSTPPTKVIEASQFSGGTYTLTVSGTSASAYSVNVIVVSDDGSIQPNIALSGVSGPGSVSDFNLQLNVKPGMLSTEVRVATPASALADIENSLNLGLIHSRSIADLLQLVLETARGFQALGGCLEADATLALFVDLVKSQSGYSIDPSVARILQEDAEYLLTGNCRVRGSH